MNQRERMLSGLPYKAWLDGLEEDRQACKQKIYDFNQLPPSRQSKEASQMIKNIFGKTGENVWVEAPFHCDYGWNIEVGENFYSNYNLTILDVGKVTIGKNVQIAPNVSIYTAGHPVHPESRASGYEYGIPITVGDNVWIGGSTVILPGVTIGNNVVIGAGSVVSKDIPDNMIAVGNPCKVIREITDEDRIYYFKKQKFDDEAWNEERDRLFFELLKKLFERRVVSVSYLIGSYFNKSWAVQSIKFLCFKRHAYQGKNLYSKGACYAAMERAGLIAERGILFGGRDMIQVNLQMEMRIRGKEQMYPLISAGMNWYEAHHVCEFILDGERELRITSQPMAEGDPIVHMMRLVGLPHRPPRATRVRMTIYFSAPGSCHIEV